MYPIYHPKYTLGAERHRDEHMTTAAKPAHPVIQVLAVVVMLALFI